MPVADNRGVPCRYRATARAAQFCCGQRSNARYHARKLVAFKEQVLPYCLSKQRHEARRFPLCRENPGLRDRMTEINRQRLSFLAKLVLALGLSLIVAGILWHGITFQTVARLWHNLLERPDGRMRFRFILQPTMAVLAALRDGRNDARSGYRPYFWAILTKPQERAERMREGLNATARIILLGVAMDMIYQALAFRTFYPNEAVIIALTLAFVPYVVVRGLVTRATRNWAADPTSQEKPVK